MDSGSVPAAESGASSSDTQSANDSGPGIDAPEGAAACPPGTLSCDGGCPAATPTLCSGSCVDPTSSVSNCGACGKACTTSIGHGLPVCSAGECTWACNSGYTACNGACVDEQTDANNCGGCGAGHTCLAGTTCQAGTCACPAGTHDCSGTCESNTGLNSCGAKCDSPCPGPANGGAYGTATCDGTTCGLACNEPYTLCGTACVDERSDSNNCGGCGIECGPGITCSTGVCFGCGTGTPITDGATDGFGSAISNNAGTAVIGTTNAWGGLGGVAYTALESGSTWSVAELLPTNGAPNGSAYGTTVALDGTTAMVGGAPSGTPTIWVFTETGTSWFYETTIMPTTGIMYPPNIAISGNTAIISGAYAATVYTGSGSSWSAQATLLPSDYVPSDSIGYFGSEVAIDGDTALVEANPYDASGQAAHWVYVFVRSGSTWSQQAKLVPSGLAATASPQFQFSLRISSITEGSI